MEKKRSLHLNGNDVIIIIIIFFSHINIRFMWMIARGANSVQSGRN